MNSVHAPQTTMQEEIVRYLWRSGLVVQSVRALLPFLPRWERRLRSRGIAAIPSLPSRTWSHQEARAHNELNLLIRQASIKRDKSIEHQLRNLTRTRRYKP